MSYPHLSHRLGHLAFRQRLILWLNSEWPSTVTFRSDRIKECQISMSRSFSSKVIVWSHTGPTALSVPLNWSVMNVHQQQDYWPVTTLSAAVFLCCCTPSCSIQVYRPESCSSLLLIYREPLCRICTRSNSDAAKSCRQTTDARLARNDKNCR